jgi:hypothetical protein
MSENYGPISISSAKAVHVLQYDGARSTHQSCTIHLSPPEAKDAVPRPERRVASGGATASQETGVPILLEVETVDHLRMAIAISRLGAKPLRRDRRSGC